MIDAVTAERLRSMDIRLGNIQQSTYELVETNKQILAVLNKLLELKTMQPTPIKQQLND